MTYLPLGLRSARNGTLSLTFWKSSRVKCRPTDLPSSSYELLIHIHHIHITSKNSTHFAMAIKCKTALVDPPRAMTMTIALRRDFGVMMSLGFKSILIKSSRYFPARRHSSNFRGSSAGVEELSAISSN